MCDEALLLMFDVYVGIKVQFCIAITLEQFEMLWETGALHCYQDCSGCSICQ